MGMMLAALPGNPIRRLVLNDIGPFIPATGLQPARHLCRHRSRASPISPRSKPTCGASPRRSGRWRREDWRHLAEISARRRPDGALGYAYDPRIGNAFRGEAEGHRLWATWDAIKVPTLVVRGADSDLLRHEDALAMTERGPRARLVELPGMGHAPALMAPDQIALVRDFLRGS